MIISSLQNPRIKAIVRMRDRRGRDRSGRFMIEGYRELRRALANGQPLETLYFCSEQFQGDNEEELVQACERAGATPIRTTPEIFAKIAYRERPEGLLGIGTQIRRGLDAVPPTGPTPLLLVAEAIEKPGNLGTMLRSADAAAVTAVIVCNPCTDLFNPNVVRASLGTLFAVVTAEAETDETIEWLRKRDISIVAATPHADLLYTNSDLTGATAIAMGAEQYGLSRAWLDAADVQVRIPMRGQGDSLNVASASALLLYEALRQRDAM